MVKELIATAFRVSSAFSRRLPADLPWRSTMRVMRGLSLSCRVPCRLWWRGTMTVVLPEMVSQTVFRTGGFEPIVTRMLIDSIEPGSTVVDVGAHFGYFSLLACHLAGPAGQVHAFEPSPFAFEVLKANLPPALGAANNCALHSSVGTAELNDFGLFYAAFNSLLETSIAGGRIGCRARVLVSTSTLDEYCTARSLRPSVVKIDAEGAEDAILDGATATIRSCRPAVVMETGRAAAVAAGRRLAGWDYVALAYDARGVPEVIANTDCGVMLAANLLFIPNERLSKFLLRSRGPLAA
jgi:FkbM family methyltransferase